MKKVIHLSFINECNQTHNISVELPGIHNIYKELNKIKKDFRVKHIIKIDLK